MSELGVTPHIVVGDGFLKPIEALVIQLMTAANGVAEAERLVEVNHQIDVAGALANGRDGGEVVLEMDIAEAELHCGNPAFALKLPRLRGDRRDLVAPEAIAVIG